MPSLKLPALDPLTVWKKSAAQVIRSPSSHASLEPGGQSSVRHWHTLEDEFVCVLEGEVVLVTNAGEQTLRAGMCDGYPAGSKDGHHFINRPQKAVKYLEMGTHVPGDTAFYPDDDLFIMWTGDGRKY